MSTSTSTSPSSAMTPVSAPASDPSMTRVTLEEFHLFSKLPIELRCKIWKCSVVPRLVTIHPHFHNPIPAIYHTSREARAESKYESNYSKFLNCIRGPVINYGIDILFFNGMSTSRSSLIQQAVLNVHMVKSVKRLALLLRSAELYTWILWPQLVNILKGLPKGEETADISSVIDNLYPLLEELMAMNLEHVFGDRIPKTIPEKANADSLLPSFILRPGPLGSTTEDMYEIDEAESENWAQDKMNTVRRTFQEAKTRGLLTSVNLKFMRTEAWQS